jgi:NAD(P)-dependent dehydrogenase (short-subunit alcohol dehydrogenase family)
MPKLQGVEACTPEEIAAAIAYLASEDARYATGTILTIDGGQTTG